MLPVTIIGIGNEDRGDDAVGLIVARSLRDLAPPGVTIHEHNGAGMALLDLWRASEATVIIDAVAADTVAGTLLRFAAHTERLPTAIFAGSSHTLGVAEVIELARALQCLPDRLIVYGIVGEQFACGADLTPQVTQAVPTVIALVLHEIALLGDAASFGQST